MNESEGGLARALVEIKELQRRMEDVETVLRGARNSDQGGMAHLLNRIVETLHGPKEHPGGILGRLDRQDATLDKFHRLLFIGAGIIIALQILNWVMEMAKGLAK